MFSLDATLFTGPCPFRRLADETAPGRVLRRLGLEGGIFVPFPALFYHSPRTGLAETEAALADEPPGVWLHGVIHPLRNERPLPGWGGPGSRVRSVLLAPDLHHYGLEEPRVRRVAEEAAANDLPVVLLRRLGDRRLAPDWLALEETPLDAIIRWVEAAPPGRLVISQITPHEATTLADRLAGRPDLYLELGGFTGSEGLFTTLLERHDFTRWLYGSGAPLHYALGNRQALEAATADPLPFDSNARDCYRI